VALQAEGRKADQQSGDAAEDGCDRDHDPRRQVEMDLAEHDGIGADAEEGGVTERDQSGVAAEQVPRQAEYRPDRNQRHDKLIVGIGHAQRHHGIERGEDDDGQQRTPSAHGHVLSTMRRRNPAGGRR
jgi:hypothetical protein